MLLQKLTRAIAVMAMAALAVSSPAHAWDPSPESNGTRNNLMLLQYQFGGGESRVEARGFIPDTARALVPKRAGVDDEVVESIGELGQEVLETTVGDTEIDDPNYGATLLLGLALAGGVMWWLYDEAEKREEENANTE